MMKRAGKTKDWKWCLAPALVSLFLLGCAPRQAQAQFIGFVSPQTTTTEVFSAQATPAVSAVVRNVGQSVHYLTYTTSGTVTQLAIQLEGSSDGINFIRISDVGTNIGSGGVFANVYLPVIRANLTTLVGVGTITATYSGSSVSPGPATGIFTTDATSSDNFLAFSTCSGCAAGEDVLNVVSPVTSTLFFSRAYLFASAAAQISIRQISSAGVTCTSVTPLPLDVQSGILSAATANAECTVDPTQIPNSIIWMGIPANETVVVDLAGYLTGRNTSNRGLGFGCVAGCTGTQTVRITLIWKEE